MSRAMNVDLSIAAVTAMCRKHSADVSVIEQLPGGSTRLVLKREDAAAKLRAAFGKRVLSADLARTPILERQRSSYWGAPTGGDRR